MTTTANLPHDELVNHVARTFDGCVLAEIDVPARGGLASSRYLLISRPHDYVVTRQNRQTGGCGGSHYDLSKVEALAMFNAELARTADRT
ncbi:MAG: hypothetical protein H6851_06305 [Geminicoccaceae bacterium]|nr:hypothetical protein [Geminicoccaceae bacterium]